MHHRLRSLSPTRLSSIAGPGVFCRSPRSTARRQLPLPHSLLPLTAVQLLLLLLLLRLMWIYWKSFAFSLSFAFSTTAALCIALAAIVFISCWALSSSYSENSHLPPSLSLCVCVSVLSGRALFSFLFKWSTSEVGMHSAARCLFTYQLKQLASKLGVCGRGMACCAAKLSQRQKENCRGTFATVKHIMHHYERRQQGERHLQGNWECSQHLPPLPPHTRSFTGIALTNCVRTARDTYRVSIMKWVTGALRGCWEWAQDKFTERDVKLINKGRSGGSGTSERDREKEWDKDRQTVRGRVISEMQMEIMTRKGNVQKEREGKQNKKQKTETLRAEDMCVHVCAMIYALTYRHTYLEMKSAKWKETG